MARIPDGREMLQCTIDSETMSILRVKAAMERITVGNLVDRLVKQAFSRCKIMEEWTKETGNPSATEPPEPKAKHRSGSDVPAHQTDGGGHGRR